MQATERMVRQEIEKFKVPHSLQQMIPVKKVYEDGVFYLTDGRYSKTYMIRDINYVGLSKDKKEEICNKYESLIAMFPTDATIKITINNRVLNRDDFRREMCLKLTGDKNDVFREEYNNAIMANVGLSNNTVKEMYITICTMKRNIEEARGFFTSTEADIGKQLERMDSSFHVLNGVERLKVIHDFFNPDRVEKFSFTGKGEQRIGKSFKDYILPEAVKINKDYIEIGDRFIRVNYMMNTGSKISDHLLSGLMDNGKSNMVTIECIVVPQNKALKIVDAAMLAVESNREKYIQKQIKNNNFFGFITSKIEDDVADVKKIHDELFKDDKRLVIATITAIQTALNKETLDDDTKAIQNNVSNEARVGVLKYQQLDGLINTLPFGVKRLEIIRTYTSKALSMLIPFNSMEVRHSGGIYFGINSKSKNIITINRGSVMNGNSFIFGAPGSGKSFAAKKEIAFIYLSDPDADIIIVDPEREYSAMVKELGGEAIEISSVSKNHLNAMEMGKGYGADEDAITIKTEFVLSLYEQIAEGKVTPAERTIISRCVELVYLRAENSGNGKEPTLIDLFEKIKQQPEAEAKRIALVMELFATGMLNCFAHERNVDDNNRLVSYDILQLSEQLRSVGMLVVLDSIWNRVTRNRFSGRKTYIYIDEIYLLFLHEYSALFLDKLWRRVRKYDACCTGITQNISPVLSSATASSMLSNSEYLVLFNQQGEDVTRLSEMLRLSDEEEKEIRNTGEYGAGLLKIGSSMVPFKNLFPTDTRLYKLMSTKASEKRNPGGMPMRSSEDVHGEHLKEGGEHG